MRSTTRGIRRLLPENMVTIHMRHGRLQKVVTGAQICCCHGRGRTLKAAASLTRRGAKGGLGGILPDHLSCSILRKTGRANTGEGPWNTSCSS